MNYSEIIVLRIAMLCKQRGITLNKLASMMKKKRFPTNDPEHCH